MLLKINEGQSEDMYLGRDNWNIHTCLNSISDKKVAQTFGPIDPSLSILFHIVVGGTKKHTIYFDKDLVVEEVKLEKLNYTTQPFNPSSSQDIEVIVASLKNMSVSYTLSDKDMEPSSETLANLIRKYGSGYKYHHECWWCCDI